MAETRRFALSHSLSVHRCPPRICAASMLWSCAFTPVRAPLERDRDTTTNGHCDTLLFPRPPHPVRLTVPLRIDSRIETNREWYRDTLWRLRHGHHSNMHRAGAVILRRTASETLCCSAISHASGRSKPHHQSIILTLPSSSLCHHAISQPLAHASHLNVASIIDRHHPFDSQRPVLALVLTVVWGRSAHSSRCPKPHLIGFERVRHEARIQQTRRRVVRWAIAHVVLGLT